MKYSTVLVAAFAAQALARAVPGENPVTDELAGATDKSVSSSSSSTSSSSNDDKYKEDKYKNTNTNNYDNTNSGYKSTDDKYKSSTDNSYKSSTSSNDYTPKYQSQTYSKSEWDSYTQKVYAPQQQKSYDQASSSPDYKHYSPLPPKDSYTPEKSCYDNFKWPVNVQKEQPCSINWAPSHGGEYTDDDDCEIHLYHTKDYSQPKHVVCTDCGKGSYDKWTPPTDCESSDESGYMYRFKFVNKKDNTKCTWGQEFPVYGQKYDNSKKEVCPPPAPVPDCPPTPPCPPPPQQAPPVIVYSAPAPSAAPEAAAPSYSAPAAAPAAPAAPAAAAPEAPAAAVPAPAAESAPVYPTTASAPVQGVANETVPAVTAGGAAIRSSVSVIVTVAALVTFLL